MPDNETLLTIDRLRRFLIDYLFNERRPGHPRRETIGAEVEALITSWQAKWKDAKRTANTFDVGATYGRIEPARAEDGLRTVLMSRDSVAESKRKIRQDALASFRTALPEQESKVIEAFNRANRLDRAEGLDWDQFIGILET